MRYLSVCSGIEAATQAWHPLGWSPVAFSEIELFPCKVLAHHYPDVPNLGDMTKFKEWNIEQPDLLVGGTPCQSFSVAGLRKGLDDPRGNLMLTYLAIADRFKPKWIVWENVPGVLSSNGGKDFGTFLGALGELGYGFAYRVLDAQFVRTDGYPHAIPQRRRRVFVVGYLGDWHRAAAVLFDSESLRGNPPPSRSKGQEIAADVANCIRASGVGTERIGDTRGQDSIIAVAPTLRAGAANGGKGHGARSGDSKDELIIPVCMSHGQANAEITEGYAPSLNCNHEQPIVFDEAQITRKTNRSRVEKGLPCGTLNQKGRMTIALAGNTIGREPNNGGNGTGFDESGASYTMTKTDIHAVAYETLYNEGIIQGENNAGTHKSDPGTLLSRVRKEIGAQAFTEWGFGILDSLQEKEILRQVLHGKEFRQASFSRSWVVCCSLGSPFTCSEGAMQSLREACGERCPSQGWESLKQLSGELGTYLSGLSQPGTQAERFMLDMWEAAKGLGLLQQTLFEIQKTRRSIFIQKESTHPIMQVRRLTVGECTFLQGFPRNYLSQVLGYSDSAAYKALGNSMAVNVMQLIGERIQMVENISKENLKV